MYIVNYSGFLCARLPCSFLSISNSFFFEQSMWIAKTIWEERNQFESRNTQTHTVESEKQKPRLFALMFFFLLDIHILSVFRQSWVDIHAQRMHTCKHSHNTCTLHAHAHSKFNYNNGFYYFQFYVILIVLFNMHFIRLRHFGWLHFFTLLCVWTWKNRTRKKNEQSERASERTGRRVHE